MVNKKQTLNRDILTTEEQKHLQQHSQLKLQIELVPGSCFYSNVRAMVKKSQWDKIRFKVYALAGNKCEICGEVGSNHQVECHEVWVYDDELLIQKLLKLEALCPACHGVKHLALSTHRGYGEEACERFDFINGISSEDLSTEIKRVVFKQHRIRSHKKWAVNVDLLKEYAIDVSLLDLNRVKIPEKSFLDMVLECVARNKAQKKEKQLKKDVKQRGVKNVKVC